MKYLSAFFLCWLLSMAVQAQDLAADWKQLQQKYKGLTQLHAMASSRSYTREEKGWDISAPEKVEFFYKNQQYFYKASQLDILISGQEMLMINHAQQLMVLQVQKADKEAVQQALQPDIDEILKNYSEIKFLGVEEGLKHYLISTPDQEVVATEIWMDVEKGYIKKTLSFYNKELFGYESKIEVIIELFDTAGSVPDTHFAVEKYLIKKGDSYSLTTAFKNYELIIPDEAE